MTTKMQGQISRQIKDELKKQEITLRKLADLTSINHGNLSRLLSGKRFWQIAHLETVAPVLGLTITDLVSDFISVPIKATLREGGFFYQDVCDPQRSIGTVAIPRPHGEKDIAKMIAKCYGVEVQRKDLPMLAPGSVLVATHDSSDQLKEGNPCFYAKDNGKACLRTITFKGDSIVLIPCAPGLETVTLPRKYLSLCDKVIMAKF